MIAPLSILCDDERGRLRVPYIACQTAITDEGLVTDVNERGENERQVKMIVR